MVKKNFLILGLSKGHDVLELLLYHFIMGQPGELLVNSVCHFEYYAQNGMHSHLAPTQFFLDYPDFIHSEYIDPINNQRRFTIIT